MLQGLAAAAEVRVVLLARDAVPPAARQELEALAAAGLAEVRLSPAAMALGAAAALACGLPPAVGAYAAAGAVRGVANRAGPGPWDLACAFQLRAAPHALAVPARAHAVELTDSLALYRQRLPRRGRSLLRRLALTGVERLEGDLPRRFDRSFVSAAADAEAVARLAGMRPAIVPNGCRSVEGPTPPPPGGPLLFVGHMPYPPNEYGVLWLLGEVWPRVRAACPDARLRLVGRPTPRVRRAARARAADGVELAGYVADLAGELAVVNAASALWQGRGVRPTFVVGSRDPHARSWNGADPRAPLLGPGGPERLPPAGPLARAQRGHRLRPRPAPAHARLLLPRTHHQRRGRNYLC
jgi:hypothetical protein